MARYDKDTDTHVITNNGKQPDKTKGQMSIREAAALEMPEQHLETSMPGTVVHGFGDGQSGTVKRHTPGGETWTPATPGTGDTVTALVEQIFQLPFQAQLGVLRMIAPRILGGLDSRDQESFLTDLRGELDSQVAGDERGQAQSMDTQDIQGT